MIFLLLFILLTFFHIFSHFLLLILSNLDANMNFIPSSDILYSSSSIEFLPFVKPFLPYYFPLQFKLLWVDYLLYLLYLLWLFLHLDPLSYLKCILFDFLLEALFLFFEDFDSDLLSSLFDDSFAILTLKFEILKFNLNRVWLKWLSKHDLDSSVNSQLAHLSLRHIW